jgi:flavodoxin
LWLAKPKNIKRTLGWTFSFCIIIFLTISGILTWKDWSYFESKPYLRKAEFPSDIMVLYYSRSGKTEAMARQIANRFNADIIKISDQSYYQGLVGILRANRDAWFQKPARIATKTIDFSNYRLIFLGSPIWWYRPAPPLWNFVQNNNFEGKTVILFNTFNSRFKEAEINKFKELVEKQGGIFLDHVYVRRGRIYNQLSGDDMIRKVQILLDENELKWRIEIGRVDDKMLNQ